MAAFATGSWVGMVLQLLPARLLRALDGWSHRRAIRKQQLRQQDWIRRRAG